MRSCSLIIRSTPNRKPYIKDFRKDFRKDDRYCSGGCGPPLLEEVPSWDNFVRSNTDETKETKELDAWIDENMTKYPSLRKFKKDYGSTPGLVKNMVNYTYSAHYNKIVVLTTQDHRSGAKWKEFSLQETPA